MELVNFFMGLMDKLFKKQQELRDRLQKGRIFSEQKRAEKLRHRHQKLVDMKPGAKKTLLTGMALNKKVLDVMKEEYDRRKFLRDKKYNK